MALTNSLLIVDGSNMAYAEMLNQIYHTRHGNYVISGCGVTEQGIPNNTVAVASGSVFTAGAVKTVSADNVDLSTEIAALTIGQAQFVYIYIDSSGNKQKLAGTAATAGQQYPPLFSSLAEDVVIIARILLTYGDSAINTADIKEMRQYAAEGGYITGQLQLPTTGSAAGLLIGGDVNLYRSAANVLTTDDTFVVGSGVLNVGANGATDLPIINLIDSAGATRGSILVGDSVHGTYFDEDALYIVSASGEHVYFYSATTQIGLISANGQMQLPITGSGAGLLIGGVLHIYNSGIAPPVIDLSGYTIISNTYSEYNLVMGWNAIADQTATNQVLVAQTHGSAGYSYIMEKINGVIEFHTYNGSVTAGAVATNKVGSFDPNGQFALPKTGSGAGLLIGGDVQLYRSAANVLTIPDSLTLGGTFLPDASGTRNMGSATFKWNAGYFTDLYLYTGASGSGTDLHHVSNAIVPITSSIRFKTNLRTIELFGEKIFDLNLYQYDQENYRVVLPDGKLKEGIHTTHGLIAEELYEVFPEAVSFDATGKILGYSTQKLVIYMIDAIKKLNVRLTTIESIAAQKP